MRRFSWRWPANAAVDLVEQVMPDVRGLPVIGPIQSIVGSRFGTRLHEYIDKLHRLHGPVFRGRVGPVESVFVSSPDVMRQVFTTEGPTPRHFLPEAWLHYNQMRNCKRGLLFMDGKEWQENRRKLNRLMLAADSVDYMIEPCQKAAEDLVSKWKEKTNKSQAVPDLENQLYKYLMEVILMNLMGTPSSGTVLDYKSTQVSDELAQSIRNIFANSVRLAAFPTSVAKTLHLSWWTNFVESADYALNDVYRIVNEIIKNPGKDGLLVRMKAEGIPNDDLKRIVADFIIAAGDVTAFSMQWLFYLLSKHQNFQDELHSKLKNLEPTEITNSPLLKGAIKESLRLYPTAPFIARMAPCDTFLAGYPVNKDELIVLSLYTSGRDEANFPKAQEFIPERWIRNERGELNGVTNPQASLPFAMGVRSCIGKKLAETQMALTIAELLKNFKIDIQNKDKITIKLRMITAPSEPLQLQLVSRN